MCKDGRQSRDFFRIVPHAGENAIHPRLLRGSRCPERALARGSWALCALVDSREGQSEPRLRQRGE